MENKFYTDNFEQLLRETTDQFRMYPSRRVWHSLYNGLHPARKWPSLAVLLLLITSIMYIGVSNPNEVAKRDIINETPLPPNVETVGALASVQTADNNTNRNTTNIQNTANIASRYRSVTGNSKSSVSTTGFETAALVNRTSSVPATGNAAASASIRITTATPSVNTAIIENDETLITDEEAYMVRHFSTVQSGIGIGEITEVNNIPITAVIMDEELEKEKKEAVINQNILDEKAWIEDFVFHNKKNDKKFRDKIVYQFYTTPSVGFRTLSNSEFSPSPASLIDGEVNTLDNSFNHTHALNLEAGGNILYSFSKNLRFKAGVQINYTNYKVNAYELNHPTVANVMMTDINTGNNVLESHNTMLANTPGLYSKNLNNNTYQLSLPLGADFKIAGNNKIKWYAGATVQPTFVAGGNAYLISADLKNYVADNSMMRRFNLNGGLETFVSYKTRHGIILNAGPQIRYQFLSTYVKQYTFDERLYNIGMKLGITTNF